MTESATRFIANNNYYYFYYMLYLLVVLPLFHLADILSIGHSSLCLLFFEHVKPPFYYGRKYIRILYVYKTSKAKAALRQ